MVLDRSLLPHRRFQEMFYEGRHRKDVRNLVNPQHHEFIPCSLFELYSKYS